MLKVEATKPERALQEAHHKFETLDGLRGVAAIAVVMYHWPNLFGGRQWFAHGYLAVDLFFILSGFVMAFAYQRKMDEGLTTRQFLQVRLIRLYPLYLLCIIPGLWIRHYLESLEPLGAHGLASLLGPLFLALLFLPLLGLSAVSGSRQAFPLNVPSWSLFFELLANVIHASVLRRRSTRTLLVCVIICIPVLAFSAYLKHSLNIGARRDEILLTFPRVVAPYITGMLLHRLWRAKRFVWSLPPYLPLLATIAVLAIPDLGRWDTLVDLCSSLILFPVVVSAAALSTAKGRAASAFTFLGMISYGVYVLHFALMYGATIVVERLSMNIKHTEPILGPVLLLGLALLVTLLDIVYDRPVRDWLKGRFVRQP